MIKVIVDGVISSKPQIIQNNGLSATVFSLKSGKDVVSVATEPNAINMLKKGDNLSVKGIFSPTNCIIGATEITNHSKKAKTASQPLPVEKMARRTKKKPQKDGTFELPKSARVITETEVVPVVAKKVPTQSNNVSSATETVSIPKVTKTEPKKVKEAPKTDENGLPLPTFNLATAGVSVKMPNTDKSEKVPAQPASKPKKKTRWTNDDFALS